MSPQFEHLAALRDIPQTFTEVDRHIMGEHARYGIYRHEPTQRYTYRITLKVVGGIREAVGWWPWDTQPRASQLLTVCLRDGLLSRRPYQLGQPHDSTTPICVWSLYANYCHKNGYNPTDLLRRAYPYNGMERQWTPQIWSDLLEQADWEGICFPLRWDAASATQLFRALHHLDEAPLAELLARKLARTTLKSGTTPPHSGGSVRP